jgi:hypothetical protein
MVGLLRRLLAVFRRGGVGVPLWVRGLGAGFGGLGGGRRVQGPGFRVQGLVVQG